MFKSKSSRWPNDYARDYNSWRCDQCIRHVTSPYATLPREIVTRNFVGLTVEVGVLQGNWLCL